MKSLKSMPLIAVLLCSLFATSVIAIVLYRTSVPSSITITQNDYTFLIFEDEGHTIPLTSIPFPSIIEGIPGNGVVDFTFYIQFLPRTGGRRLSYSTVNMPTEFTLSADINDLPWIYPHLEYGDGLDSTIAVMHLNINGAGVGTYSFTIAIDNEPI